MLQKWIGDVICLQKAKMEKVTKEVMQSYGRAIL